MKTLKYLSITLAAAAVLSVSAAAQNDLKVPLSNPGQPGKLSINTVYADDVIIRAHQGSEVIVKFDSEDDRDRDRETRGGLRRISTSGSGLEVTEDNNTVTIRTAPNSHDLELEVLVPAKFSLNLSVTHGDIEVDGLDGEHEIKSVNGDVEMRNISGSALVNSVNGDIEIDFVRVTAGAPMSFTGVNGDIEITLPAGTKLSAKMKTEWGDIYTNFEMEIDRSSSSTEVTSDDGKYKVAVNKWVYGKVNGGGPEYLFKTLHGDISIRKK